MNSAGKLHRYLKLHRSFSPLLSIYGFVWGFFCLGFVIVPFFFFLAKHFQLIFKGRFIALYACNENLENNRVHKCLKVISPLLK